MLNLQEMINYIRARYTTDLGETEFVDHINEVYRDISTLFTPDVTEKDTTLKTEQDKETYQLPVLSRQIKQVHFGAGESIVRLRTMLEESIIYPRKKGTPISWYPCGFKSSNTVGVYQMFGLDPIPDSASSTKDLIVYYEPTPVAMSANDDEPQYVPDEMHYLICWGTIAILAGKQEDYDVAQYWEAKYRSAYNEKLAGLALSRHANFPEATRKVKGS